MRTGDQHPNWKGGSYIEPGKGYRMIRMPEHPRARANGYVLEHILVAEKMLGRSLAKGEEVHHKNGERADNRPENLLVHDTHNDHWVGEGHQAAAVSARWAGHVKKSRKQKNHETYLRRRAAGKVPLKGGKLRYPDNT